MCGAAPLGAVVQFTGTPRRFVCAADGLLHWGGDARALAQQAAAGASIEWPIRGDQHDSWFEAVFNRLRRGYGE